MKTYTITLQLGNGRVTHTLTGDDFYTAAEAERDARDCAAEFMYLVSCDVESHPPRSNHPSGRLNAS